MRKVVFAALAALTLIAVPAFAADATLTAGSKFEWDGGPGTGQGPGDGTIPFGYARCSAVYQCEDKLFEIKDAGSTLTVEIKAGDGSEDLDLRLYKSDAEGNHDEGDLPVPTDDPTVVEDISTNKDAKVVVKNIKPGFYKAQVAFYKATNGVYKGTATLSGGSGTAPAVVAPVAPATPPASAPAPSSSTNSKAKARAKAKAKAAYNKCVKKAKKKYKGKKNKKKLAKAKKACKKKRK